MSNNYGSINYYNVSLFKILETVYQFQLVISCNTIEFNIILLSFSNSIKVLEHNSMSMKMKSTFKVCVRKCKQILLWYGLYTDDINYKNKKH